MTVRNFALIVGIIYLAVGILGFIPGITQYDVPAPPDLAVNTSYGYLLGIFPVNLVHNLVHLLVGIWGLASYRSFGGSRMFAQGLAILYGLLTVLGFITPNLLGLAPIFGADIALHLLTALLAAYFGWVAGREVVTAR